MKKASYRGEGSEIIGVARSWSLDLDNCLNDIFSKFNSQVKKEKQDLIEIANFFNDMTSIETRLQIVHFLFAVSNADGHVSKQEVNKILEISRFFSIRNKI